MSKIAPTSADVVPVAEARAALSSVLRDFRHHGADAAGRHRIPPPARGGVRAVRAIRRKPSHGRARPAGVRQPKAVHLLDEIRRRRALIHRLARANRIASVPQVFGSVARGDETPSSDVDLLVEPRCRRRVAVRPRPVRTRHGVTVRTARRCGFAALASRRPRSGGARRGDRPVKSADRIDRWLTDLSATLDTAADLVARRQRRIRPRPGAAPRLRGALNRVGDLSKHLAGQPGPFRRPALVSGGPQPRLRRAPLRPRRRAGALGHGDAELP